MRAWTVLCSPGEGMNYAIWLSRVIRKVLSICKLRVLAFHSETIQTDAQSLRVLFDVFFHSFSDADKCQPDHLPSLLVISNNDTVAHIDP